MLTSQRDDEEKGEVQVQKRIENYESDQWPRFYPNDTSSVWSVARSAIDDSEDDNHRVWDCRTVISYVRKEWIDINITQYAKAIEEVKL